MPRPPLRAFWRQWKHCVFGAFTGHQQITVRTMVNRRIVVLSCTCGQAFYVEPVVRKQEA